MKRIVKNRPPKRLTSKKLSIQTPFAEFDEIKFSRFTQPKPFVFVLMPFREEFNDIYMYGIKAVAEEVGAYAERVDEQDYMESILERIYNQINKADIIVADMTGQNPNVFYEVGYAHALGKIVLLLTQNANDIPFDLKHRPHTIYRGRIEIVREQLRKRLIWAISELKKTGEDASSEILDVSIRGIEVPENIPLSDAPLIFRLTGSKITYSFRVIVRNSSPDTINGISYIYLFAAANTHLTFLQGKTEDLKAIEPYAAHPFDSKDDLLNQYRLEYAIPALPPGVTETFDFNVQVVKRVNAYKVEERLRLRLHSATQIHDYPFKLEIIKENKII